jgi:hypothetical protein
VISLLVGCPRGLLLGFLCVLLILGSVVAKVLLLFLWRLCGLLADILGSLGDFLLGLLRRFLEILAFRNVIDRTVDRVCVVAGVWLF